MTDIGNRWDDTYAARADNEVSWYQALPERSLAMIQAAVPGSSAGIVDVGGGASRLVDGLLAEGYADVSVLDVSTVALERSKARLGALAERVSWIVADVTVWRPERAWDVWHDRAVFHFLTEPKTRDAYIAALRQGTRPGAAVIMATFAPTGPGQCSGLPVMRYGPAGLADCLGPDFALYEAAAEVHRTPSGSTQDFTYTAFRRK
ncbi:MAG: class I SAM-dependent methyltransferase [Thalassobaculum sp.]|uniref:class I SAM-dependent methyltransferase n=1 Tax=Thalassobaculum sp. TaxID=2022740 RepID=UPI0032EFB2B7